MAQLVDLTFSVAGLLVAFLAGVLWVSLRPASSGARRYLIGALVFYLLAGVYLVPYGIGRILVAGFHELTAADVPPGPTAIVLLGGGSVTVRDWRQQPFSVVSAVGAARAFEAFRVSRLLPDARIVSSGGRPDGQGIEQSDAVIMRAALVQLGIPDSRIALETGSLTTHDEAVLVAPMLRAQGVRQVVLVTSDVHMRRSLGAFRAQGMPAIPAIARDPYLALPWKEKVLPTKYGLETSGAIVHEVLGIVYYAARGWLRFSS